MPVDGQVGSDSRQAVLVDAGRFFTHDLASALTHFTASITFFSPLPPGESDYEKWKSVFNVIQGLEEVKYFVCIREKDSVLGKFSSAQSLKRTLNAVAKMKSMWRPSAKMMDPMWLEEVLMKLPELSKKPKPSMRKLKGSHWYNKLFKKLYCIK